MALLEVVHKSQEMLIGHRWLNPELIMDTLGLFLLLLLFLLGLFLFLLGLFLLLLHGLRWDLVSEFNLNFVLLANDIGLFWVLVDNELLERHALFFLYRLLFILPTTAKDLFNLDLPTFSHLCLDLFLDTLIASEEWA